jgi:hypothetical protein
MLFSQIQSRKKDAFQRAPLLRYGHIPQLYGLHKYALLSGVSERYTLFSNGCIFVHLMQPHPSRIPY